MKAWLIAFSISAPVFSCVACDRAKAPSWDNAFPADWPRPTYETVKLELGGKTLTVELADTNERRRYGYMFVPEPPPDDRGMLFVYPEPMPLNFWMRNTRIALDLIYLSDDGRVLNFHRSMRPFDETSRHESLAPCRYALEVRGGWCADHSIRVGTRATFSPEILAAKPESQAILENIPALIGP